MAQESPGLAVDRQAFAMGLFSKDGNQSNPRRILGFLASKAPKARLVGAGSDLAEGNRCSGLSRKTAISIFAVRKGTT
jgi:hypothetical protein